MSNIKSRLNRAAIALIAIGIVMAAGAIGMPREAEAVIEPIYTLPFHSKYQITCQFHCYYDPVYGWHEGTDYAVGASGTGELVVAAANGTGKNCGFDVRAGYYVVMDHGNGHRTRYLHLNGNPPFSSDHVFTRGEVVGLEGSTGAVTGPHLHFETRVDATSFTCGKDGTAVDPYR